MKIISIILISIVLGIGAGWIIFSPKSQDTATDTSKERKIMYYRDPMNPQNTSETPKKAPDGMDYVPVYEEQSSGGEKKIAYYQDPMHPWFTSDKPGKAPDCGMDLVPVYEGGGDAKGVKIDPRTIQNIGVKTEPVLMRTLTKEIRSVGRIDFDETRVYNVNTKYMGWIEKLYVDYTGQYVRKGEPLMELYSPDLFNAQQEYLQAYQYKKQMEQSSLDEMKKSSSTLLEGAKRKLMYWDIPESDIAELENSGKVKKTMTIYSPFEGIVMEKMVVKGQNVMTGMEMYKIVDLSTVWIYAEIYQFELPWIKMNQDAEIEISYYPGKPIKGKITYIYPSVNMESRTAKVRIEVKNTETIALKPEMFVTVKIQSPISVKTIAVPEQAIIRSGERNIAVIALGGGFFDPREIKLGVSAGGYVQVLEGIHEDESIVVSSQFLIDSESNLKAAINQMSGKTTIDTNHAAMQMKIDEHKGHNMEDSSGMSMKEDDNMESMHHDDQTGKKSEGKQLYTCEMHPDVIRDKPGDCPKCGMKLVPKK